MDIVLGGQTGDAEVVRENFNKIRKAFMTLGIGLPEQSGNGGKYLQTDGTNPSWQSVDRNIDGGFAAETYLPIQNFDGGGA